MCAHPKIIQIKISLKRKHNILLLLQYLDEWTNP
jgi:hypothetical protein